MFFTLTKKNGYLKNCSLKRLYFGNQKMVAVKTTFGTFIFKNVANHGQVQTDLFAFQFDRFIKRNSF